MKITRIRNASHMIAVVLSLSLAFVPSVALASSIERMSLAKMARTATLIVRAKCIANSSQWQAGEIWTITRLELTETWKGSPPFDLTVRSLGGSVGTITSTVEGVPHFRAGEDVVLFLEPTKYGDYAIESWAQGTFRIALDPRSATPLVTQDTASSSTYDPSTHSFTISGIRGQRLSEFRATVISAISGAKTGAQ